MNLDSSGASVSRVYEAAHYSRKTLLWSPKIHSPGECSEGLRWGSRPLLATVTCVGSVWASIRGSRVESAPPPQPATPASVDWQETEGLGFQLPSSAV